MRKVYFYTQNMKMNIQINKFSWHRTKHDYGVRVIFQDVEI